MEASLEKVLVNSCYAHSCANAPIEEWQPLQDHARRLPLPLRAITQNFLTGLVSKRRMIQFEGE